MRSLVRSIIPMVVLLLPAFASADDRGVFVSLDRQGTDSAVGLNVVGHFFSQDADIDLALRENVFGRYVDASGFGVFGQMFLSHAFGNGDSTTGVSNLELGGLYAH